MDNILDVAAVIETACYQCCHGTVCHMGWPARVAGMKPWADEFTLTQIVEWWKARACEGPPPSTFCRPWALTAVKDASGGLSINRLHEGSGAV